MKFKVYNKFFLTTSLIFLISLTIISVVLCFSVSDYLTKEKQDVLKKNCNIVAHSVYEINPVTFNPQNLVPILGAVSKISDADVFMADLSGNVVICSCDDWAVDGVCLHNSKKISNEYMQKAIKQELSEIGNLDGAFSNLQYICSLPISLGDGTLVGTVFSTLSAQNIRNFFTGILRVFFFSALIPIIVMFFAEYFISYKLIKPLRLMADAARSMAKGDFSKRIPVTSDDEIGELSVAFNQMTNSLVQLEGTRRRFIANVSHELKTPMTTISGFIDGIVDGTISEEKRGHYLSIVSSEVKRLSRLVQSMLSLTKLESGEQKINSSNFEIADMLCKIVVSQEQRIEDKNINIKGLDLLTPTFINADYDLIYQVIYNLVDNAIKFTDSGGVISFKITDNNNFVEFKIRNTGAGIEQKDLPFVFERFYKTDKSRSAVKDSIGLGLYLANTIVSIHGGKISVQSEVNNFTEFTVVLPQNN